MSIGDITPPYGDLPDGYTVSQLEWNGQFNSIFDYLNGVVKPAINDLINAPPPQVGAQSFFNARLTLQSGIPVSITDQPTKTTLFLTAFNGNLIGTYDPLLDAWTNRKLTADLSLTVPTATRDLHDIYVYWTGSALALEASLAYYSVVASNNPTAGTSKVININDTSHVAVGDVVSITDGSNQEEAVVTAVSTNVSITVDWLVSSYTAPTVRMSQPQVALTTQDGILVKSTDKTRRYVGTVLVVNNTISDTLGHRGIGNHYNKVERAITAKPTSTSYSIAGSSSAGANNDKTLGVERILIISGGPQNPTPWSITRQELLTTTPGACFARQQIDGVLSDVFGTQQSGSSAATFNGVTLIVNDSGSLDGGSRHFIQDWFDNEAAGARTATNKQGGSSDKVVSWTKGWVRN